MKPIQNILLAVALALTSVTVQALEDKLVVVTSFPKDLTKQFKDAFEKKNPGLKVEML